MNSTPSLSSLTSALASREAGRARDDAGYRDRLAGAKRAWQKIRDSVVSVSLAAALGTTVGLGAGSVHNHFEREAVTRDAYHAAYKRMILTIAMEKNINALRAIEADRKLQNAVLRTTDRKGRVLAALGHDPAAGVHVLDPDIRMLMNDMRRRSPTFERMVSEMEKANFRVWVADMKQVGQVPKEQVGLTVLPLSRDKPRVEFALITIDKSFFNDALHSKSAAGREMGVGEMAATIAHEFAHAHSIAISEGRPKSFCDDPGKATIEKGDHARELASCVMQQENLIRHELGLPQNRAYGINLGSRTLAAYTERHQRLLDEMAIHEGRLDRAERLYGHVTAATSQRVADANTGHRGIRR